MRGRITTTTWPPRGDRFRAATGVPRRSGSARVASLTLKWASRRRRQGGHHQCLRRSRENSAPASNTLCRGTVVGRGAGLLSDANREGWLAAALSTLGMVAFIGRCSPPARRTSRSSMLREHLWLPDWHGSGRETV